MICRNPYRNLSLILALIGISIPAQTEYQRIPKAIQSSEIAHAHQLHRSGEYYQALKRLEPLLVDEHGGEAQEEALWLANTLCEKFVRYNILVKWVDNAFTDRTLEGEFRSAEPYLWLNDMGANIHFNQVTMAYAYHYGFLKTLIERHPESSHVPAARYYLIPRNFNNRADAETWVTTLEDYLKKHENHPIPERVWAQLDLARIQDILWELIVHPSHFSTGFTTDDAVGDRAYAEQCREAALGYYDKVLDSGLEGRFGEHSRAYIEERYNQLKAGVPEEALWALYD